MAKKFIHIEEVENSYIGTVDVDDFYGKLLGAVAFLKKYPTAKIILDNMKLSFREEDLG